MTDTVPPTARPIPSTGLRITRRFSNPEIHPYDEVTWEHRDVVQSNWKTGETIFEQRGVEFPDFWSLNASTIVTTKYFRGALGTEQRETSLRQLIDRIVLTYTQAGRVHGYFATPEDATVFEHELTWMLLHQVFSFNSPVWFNVGTNSPQQVSACFILSVDDTMDSILNWYREEGLIFKGGSGAGVNLSRIRSARELLRSSGGTASGPVSFMRGADASAGTIKSGGATRRAAKMVVLDVDHPDIEEFVQTKVREENKIRVLRDAGFDMDLGGEDITSVQYQNANNSVRVSDEFMRAVDAQQEFLLRARTTDETWPIDAHGLFRQIAEAAWACADPGLQYDDTINAWHTNPETGRITASNPCSEYLSLDNSSCNLASLNLMKFLREDGMFDVDAFTYATEIVITAMDISICFADFPTDAIGDTTRDYRQLGIGYTNLGALLMTCGLAYDSPEGRGVAAAVTSLMTGTAYRRSAELAEVVGAYAGYARNAHAHTQVMRRHRDAAQTLASVATGNGGTFVDDGIAATTPMAAEVAGAGLREWDRCLEVGAAHGWRNAQASVLAPTGTISFMLDSDTTGIEPDFSLLKFKKLVGGGSLQVVNGQVAAALQRLGYQPETVEAIEAYIAEHGHVVDAPGLKPEHYAIFDTAMGQRSIAPMGHVRMMAAVQPFISGAISKTVNLPESATVEDIEDIYYQGWRLGLKAVAVYRDNCKVGQPLSSGSSAKDDTVATAPEPVRRRLPRKRASDTVSFRVGEIEGYLTSSMWEDGTGPGELFLKMSKQGSTLAGVMDAFSMAVSIGLQYGVPLETYVAKFVNMRFEPAGITDDPDVRMAQSILDYIFRRLALDYLPEDVRGAYGIYTTAERTAILDGTHPAPAMDTDPVPAAVVSDVLQADAPMCLTCGTSAAMQRSGACWSCSNCGGTTGCG